jgi:hypothetical protein
MRKLRQFIVPISEVFWWGAAIITWIGLMIGGWIGQGWWGLFLALTVGTFTILTTMGIVIVLYDINDSLRLIAGRSSKIRRQNNGRTSSSSGETRTH